LLSTFSQFLRNSQGPPPKDYTFFAFQEEWNRLVSLDFPKKLSIIKSCINLGQFQAWAVRNFVAYKKNV